MFLVGPRPNKRPLRFEIASVRVSALADLPPAIHLARRIERVQRRTLELQSPGDLGGDPSDLAILGLISKGFFKTT
jgi:hypothetical protein